MIAGQLDALELLVTGPRFRYYNPDNFEYGVPCGWCAKPAHPYHPWGGGGPATPTHPRWHYAICKACETAGKRNLPLSESEYIA